MTLEEIVQRFDKASKTGADSYQCCCSAHDDKKASLSIKKGNDTILLYCHAGCDIKDILRKAGLKMSDLYNEKSPNIYNEKKRKRVVEKEYFYTDINNTILYKAIRYTNKEFHPAKLYNGKWIYNLDNIERIPYNLPNVVKSEIIYWVEGEKDADNLNKIGLTATTSIRRSIKFF